MSRPRIHVNAATRQRAYRERLKTRHHEAQGPTDDDLARTMRDLHIRLEYAAAVMPSGFASKLIAKMPWQRYVMSWLRYPTCRDSTDIRRGFDFATSIKYPGKTPICIVERNTLDPKATFLTERTSPL